MRKVCFTTALAMFFAGVFFSGYLDSNIPVFIISFVTVFISFATFLKIKELKHFIAYTVVAILTFSFGVGYFSRSYDELFLKSEKFKNSSPETLEVTAVEVISDNLNGQRFILKTKDNIRIDVSYTGKDDILPGDIVTLKKPVLKIVNKYNFLSKNVKMISRKAVVYTECTDKNLEISGNDKHYLLNRNFHKIRKNTFFTLLKYLSFDEAAFCYSVLSSDKAYISAEQYDRFVKSGILHLCTVSGFHFTFLCMFIVILTVGFLKPYRPRIILTVIVSTVFLLYTGFSPSVLRAYLMFFSVKICDIFFVERISTKSVLACMTSLFAFVNPLIIYDISFILTFSAIFGLVFLLPELRRIFYGKSFFGKNYIITALSVNIFMLPVCYSIFGKVSLWSFITNFLVEIAVGFLMIISVIICIISRFSSALGYIFAPLLKLIVNYVFLVTKVSDIGFDMKITFPLSMITVVFLILSVYLFLIFFKSSERRKMLLALLCLCISVTVFFYVYQFMDSNAYITYIGNTTGVDIIYKHNHYVICSASDLKANPQTVALKQNEKIKVLYIIDEVITDEDAIRHFSDTYCVEKIYTNRALFENDVIKISYDDAIRFEINGERFVISPDMRYTAYNAEKEENCNIIFTDYGEPRYKELIKILEFPKSVTPVIKAEGYEKLICTDNYSLITVTKSGETEIN